MGPFAIERGDGRIESDAADEPFENQHTGGSLCSTLATQYRRHGVCLLRCFVGAFLSRQYPPSVRPAAELSFRHGKSVPESSASMSFEILGKGISRGRRSRSDGRPQDRF